jgi:hypothetical protein
MPGGSRMMAIRGADRAARFPSRIGRAVSWHPGQRLSKDRSMRARLPLIALSLLLPACGMERSASLTAPPVGAKTVRLCAAVEGKLRDFTGWVDPATGDTLVSGKRFRELFPASYGSDETWFRQGGQLPAPLNRYRPYSTPRPLLPDVLRQPGLELAHRLGSVEVFATLPRHEERNRSGPDDMFMEEILYVPVHAGCVFQPYQDPSDYGWVRDDP